MSEFNEWPDLVVPASIGETGDILTIDGIWSRPKFWSLAGFCVLVFGFRREAAQAWWWLYHSAFGWKWAEQDEPIHWVRRRDMFKRRELRKFRAKVIE